MKKIAFIILFFTCFSCFYANNSLKADSLLKVLPSVKTDTAKISLLLEIAYTYKNFETKNALKYATQAYKLAQKVGDKEKIANSKVALALIDYRLGNNDSAIEQFYWVINHTEDTQTAKRSAYVNIGNVYVEYKKTRFMKQTF
jgi:hypothetical protein